MKVFPATTRDGTKMPLIKDWYTLATSDPVQIAHWQQQFGSQISFWGVPTGSVNGIVAVDIDVKKGINGYESAKNHGLTFPNTMCQNTPTGGKHYIYKAPQDIKLGNTTSSFAPAVDTRGEKGWIAYYGFDSTPIADAPEWLLKSKKEETTVKSVNYTIEKSLAESMLEELCIDIANAPPGESNDTLNSKSFQAASTLLTTGSLSKDYVYDKLFQAAKMRGKPDSEARATIESGLTSGLRAGPSFECPFEPVIVQHIKPNNGRWTPPFITVEMMKDHSKSRSKQLFKDWSNEDICITTGDGGTGKTTLKLVEAVCLALGQRFLGFECVQAGKTLYIIGEDEVPKIASLLGRIAEDMQLTDEQYEIVSTSIIIKKDIDLCLITKEKYTGFITPNYAALDKVMECVDDIKPKMIVFDPIASFWGSEASLNDMSKAVAKFSLMLKQRSNACVELINHMGKSSSQSKDMSQFAGRGGSALPSHARVSRTVRTVLDQEYTELTGSVLEPFESCLMIMVNKFTDGSPLLNKAFLAKRTGYNFEKIDITAQIVDEKEKQDDIDLVHDFIVQCRKENKYPTKTVVIAQLRNHISKDRVNSALSLLQFSGTSGNKIKYIDNPDVMNKERAIVLTDMNEVEI